MNRRYCSRIIKITLLSILLYIPLSYLFNIGFIGDRLRNSTQLQDLYLRLYDKTVNRHSHSKFVVQHAPPTGSILGEDPARKLAIVDAFKHAWRAYERDAFGSDDFNPLSHKGDNLSKGNGVGYMIVDSLDTMMLMRSPGDEELDGMYDRAFAWIEKDLDFSQVGAVSTFETTIRVLGGLLSAYHLTDSDQQRVVFLRQAEDLGRRLMSAFKTPTGLPLSSTDLRAMKGIPDRDTYGMVSTAEVATLQLEFKYLSHLTGDNQYWKIVAKVMKKVHEALPKDQPALVPILISPITGQFDASEIRLGSRADSYYEYLLKQYLLTNRTEPIYREMYNTAVDAMHDNLFKRTATKNLLYTVELEPVLYRKEGTKQKYRVSHKQDHLVCFLGGALMLGATEGLGAVPPVLEKAATRVSRDWNSGKELIETCMHTHETETGLSPEIVMFYDPTSEKHVEKATAMGRDWFIKGSYGDNIPWDAKYILRPETVESLFIAFRLTGDVQYREWGWHIFQAIEKHCKLPVDRGGGYVSVKHVDRVLGEANWDDRMETFFLASLFLLEKHSGQ